MAPPHLRKAAQHARPILPVTPNQNPILPEPYQWRKGAIDVLNFKDVDVKIVVVAYPAPHRPRITSWWLLKITI